MYNNTQGKVFLKCVFFKNLKNAIIRKKALKITLILKNIKKVKKNVLKNLSV